MLQAKFTLEKAKQVGDELKVDWTKTELEQFRAGLEVELEHGTQNRVTNVTNDDLNLTGKIALAHLNEIPDYYTRLHKMERKGEHYWARFRRLQKKKEDYVTAVGEIRDNIIQWKNKIEYLHAEVNTVHLELAKLDFTAMKKQRLANRTVELEAACKKEMAKLDELKQEVLEFDKKVEADFSHGRERIRGWVRLHRSKLFSRVESRLEHLEKVKRSFQALNRRYEKCIVPV